jgi:putative cardiolipin synthase
MIRAQGGDDRTRRASSGAQLTGRVRKGDEARAAELTVGSKLADAPSLTRFALQPEVWTERFAAILPRMHAGPSRVHTDVPDAGAVSHHMPAAIRDLLAKATSELLIANAYVIPGQHAVDRTRDLVRRGVAVRMLTNSLASHDVPAVNSHYKPWRRRLIEAGVQLYEVRPDAATRPLLADTAPPRGDFMGFHAKVMVVDAQRVFIGSMEPRPPLVEREQRDGRRHRQPGARTGSGHGDQARHAAGERVARDPGPRRGARLERRRPAVAAAARAQRLAAGRGPGLHGIPRDLY